MKKMRLTILLFCLMMTACQNNEKTLGQKMDLGIHEILSSQKDFDPLIKELQATHIQLEEGGRPHIFGYINVNDSLDVPDHLLPDSCQLLRSHFTVDKENQYHALVMVRSKPALNLSDVKNTGSYGNQVKIFFNRQGASKWAELTRNNRGKYLAFVIGNQVYSLPLIQDEIRNGAAVIKGLENPKMATKVSEGLYRGIQD